jgi:hypothetical protein
MYMADTTPTREVNAHQHAHDRQRLQHTARRGARQAQPPDGLGYDRHARAAVLG